ncbi:hypothetical protein [Sphingobacterium bambusae]|uniref:DUF4044 domain-containing protein n=1 Tax=Sphingobacterium bambusae TaxID=662858 RepID=A0ABW6BL48_9SPHI|nr:hypothetical protein [Sphingobacterium bambusae]WPL49480.1 hypothetical protein SCB77_03320 [Sphingobacterium bambusae]
MARKNWFSRQLAEIKSTLVPVNPTDSLYKKFLKQIVWIMFLLLMLCGTIAMLTAISFAH